MSFFDRTQPSRILTLTALTAILAAAPVASADPVRVEIRQAGESWQLLRGGEAYYVKGAGGDGSKKLLAECGGNSFRTWGVDDKTQSLLDEAQRLGLTVTVGIWLGHERHGFNYSSLDQIAAQMKAVREAVLKFKDHPAVLCWALGNEMEGEGNNAAVWSHIESLAVMVKKLDPNHPTMTVVAEIGGRKVEAIHALCPSLDLVGINSYGGVRSLPERYRKAGGTKPYVVTEFGPNGVWEIPKNSLGTVDEPSSSAKAATYRQAYQALKTDSELCQGSYAFTWGFKQEATATWFGLLLPDGNRLAGVDELTALWSGSAPKNLCPQIDSLALSVTQAKSGATIKATLKAADPEGGKLTVKWLLAEDAQQFVTGGDIQVAPPEFAKAIVASSLTGAEVRLPEFGGLHRLYVYVADSSGGAATANVPIQVDGPARFRRGSKAELPLLIAGEAGEKEPFAASGYMGNTTAIAMDEKCQENPHTGKTCLKVTYKEPDGWGGVVWQNPASDWGDLAGGLDLTGAKRLRFFARGEEGGEKVKFGFGLIGREKQYFDTTKAEREFTLTSEWKEYSFDLADRDLSRIKTGFTWVLGASGKPVVFYLDDVTFE